MNKTIKLSIIASSVILLLGAGGAYYRFEQLQQKKVYFEEKLAKTKAMLPKAISIEKTSESSFFETNSVYTIQIKENKKNSTSKLVINTNLKHGFSYLFSGLIEGTATGKIEGPFAKEFKSLDKLFDSKIKVLPDFTLITDTKFADLTAKDGSELKGITSYFETTKNEDDIKTDFKIASISSPKSPDGQSMFNIKGIDFQYKGKTNDLGNNHLSFKLAEIKSVFAQVQNVSFVADSTVKSGNVDLTSSLSIDKITASQWKDASFNFKYSILGLNESSMKDLYSIGQKTTSTNAEELTTSINEIEVQAKNLLTHGFKFNIDKFAFKSGTDNFDFSFKSSLPKSKSFEEFNLEKNLHILSNIDTKGSFSTPLAQILNQRLNSINISSSDSLEPQQPQEEQIVVNNNELKVSFEIKNGKGTLNGKEFTTDQNDIIHIVLSTIDEKVQAKKSAPLATTPVTASVAPQPATVEPAKK